MKNKNLLIIGAVVIAAIFFFKRKKTTIVPPPPLRLPVPVDNLFPVDMLPQGFKYPSPVYEGMRAVGFDTQYLIKDGKKYGITFAQWEARGFDAGEPVDQSILNLIPDGGVLPINIV
jgi:hypothetical protein